MDRKAGIMKDLSARFFKIITLGCKVNQYESAFIKESLLNSGFAQASERDRADAVIINTCTVTGPASHQSRQSIRRAIRENPKALIAVTGCYVQAYPEEVSSIGGVGLVIGNKYKKDAPALLIEALQQGISKKVIKAFSKQELFEPMPVKTYPDRARAFLKVQDGCESFCSYCIVPQARGPSRSLDPLSVIEILEELSGRGYREVVLTGIHLGRYGIDLTPSVSLGRLLRLIGERQLPLRIRLSSIEPNEIDNELISLAAKEPWICSHFHIPLQSGDMRTLKAMNRHYSPEQFAGLVEAIHDAIPFGCIGVDVMSGFPGESERGHANTVSLLEDLPISYLHVFPFSPRQGTRAATFAGRVEPALIKARAAELRQLSREKRLAFHRLCLGKAFQVLPEESLREESGLITGTSDNYIQFLFPHPSVKKHDFITVLSQRLKGTKILGRPVSDLFPS
jgi:threonylcarbamoyladenosine tRNA methylthiotransferase MtaB